MMLAPTDRVLLAGDSLAAGLASPMKKAAEVSGIQFKGHGVVGSRIDEWDSKYIAPDLGFAPTVVVLSLGTNDMNMFDPTAQQAGHVASLLAKIRGAGARIVWIIPPTMPFSDKGVRAMVEGSGADELVHGELLDLPRGADQIHMTPSGYQAFSDAVWAQITSGTGGDTGGIDESGPTTGKKIAGGLLVAGLAAIAWKLFTKGWPWPF